MDKTQEQRQTKLAARAEATGEVVTDTREQVGAIGFPDGTKERVVLTITDTYHPGGRKDVNVAVPRITAASKVRSPG